MLGALAHGLVEGSTSHQSRAWRRGASAWSLCPAVDGRWALLGRKAQVLSAARGYWTAVSGSYRWWVRGGDTRLDWRCVFLRGSARQCGLRPAGAAVSSISTGSVSRWCAGGWT